jgi:hypothetical protein
MKIQELIYDVLTEEVKNKKQFSFLLKKWYGNTPSPEQIKEAEDNLTLFFEKQLSFTIKNPGVKSFLLRWNGRHGKGVVAPKLDDQGVPMFRQDRTPVTTLIPFKIEDIKDPGRFTLEQFIDFIDEFKEKDLAPEEDEFQGKMVLTDKKIEASRKLWVGSRDTVVNEEGFKVKFIPNARISVMYGFYQQHLIRKLLGHLGESVIGPHGERRQWCVTGRNSDDSRMNLWKTYRSPTDTRYQRIPRRTFWFIYDESKNPNVVNDPNIQKYHLSALQYCVNDYGYNGFKITSLFNDGDDPYTWNQIVAIYPQLEGREAEFTRYEEFEESELLGSNQLTRITETEGSESDFAAQPRAVKMAYIENGGTLKSGRSWIFMDNKLKDLYIVGSTAANIEDKFQSEQLIIEIKKSDEYIKLLDRHIKSVGERININTNQKTNQNMADLGVGIIYKKIISEHYAVAKTSLDNKKIQLLESKKNKINGKSLCGLYHFGYDDWMISDGVKYEAEYTSDGLRAFIDDEGQSYLVYTYVHKDSNQVDDKTFYAIFVSETENNEDPENNADDELLVHFIGAKQFDVLKQRMHEKEDGDDEDYDRFSNFDPETDVDIKEMY